MMMPGRKYQAESGYRYGFNGKENDNDVKGEGNQQDYGMRIYDPRLGRFLSTDPLTKQHPQLTPYQFASNSPISGIDLDGLEFYYTADGKLLGKFGKSTEIRIVHQDDIKYAAGLLALHNKDPKGTSPEAKKRFGHPNTAIKLGLDASSSETFSSKDAAADKFGFSENGYSIITNTERFAKIGEVTLEGKGNTTVFILGSTVQGSEDDSDPEKSDLYGTKLAAGVHTHGAQPNKGNVNNFSGKNISGDIMSKVNGGGDMDWANGKNVPIYLINPKGELRIFSPDPNYSDGDEKGKILKFDLPSDPRSGQSNPRPVYDIRKMIIEQRRPTLNDEIRYKRK